MNRVPYAMGSGPPARMRVAYAKKTPDSVELVDDFLKASGTNKRF